MFHNVRFPEGISYGSRGGPGFNTNIVVVDSGAEQRVQRWDTPKHSYDVAWGVKSLDDLVVIRNFYIARQGAAFGFRYKDWLDFTSSSNGMLSTTNLDQDLGVGNGSQTQFQLVKKYQSGATIVTRTIELPVDSTVKIAFDGVNQSSGWSVNTLTGVVTFTSPPGAGVIITCGFEFDVPVRFGKELDTVLSQEVEGFDAGNIQSIPLVEITNNKMVDETFPYRGAYSISKAVDINLNLNDGGVQIISMTVAGKSVFLPSRTDLPLGFPLVTIINPGPNTFTVKTDLGATLVTLSSNQVAVIALGYTVGGTKVYFAI